MSQQMAETVRLLTVHSGWADYTHRTNMMISLQCKLFLRRESSLWSLNFPTVILDAENKQGVGANQIWLVTILYSGSSGFGSAGGRQERLWGC